MKIKFLATANDRQYTIDNEIINGIGLSVIEFGGKFVGDDTTRNAGIIDACRDETGELFVTLEQATPVTKVTYVVDSLPVTLTPDAPAPEGYTKAIEHRGGHWTESDWIDAVAYDPSTLYVKEVA